MKLDLTLGAAALAVVASGLGVSLAQADDAETLRFGTHLTVQHNLTVNAVEPWMERVTELSDGKVQFEHFPNSQMGKAKDIYRLVGAGALDAGYTLYVQNKLPLMDIPMLPNLYEDVAAGTLAWWEVLNKAPMSDYLAELNLKPIIPIIWSTYSISMVDGKPASIDDFSNLKLRTSGGLHDQAAAALGIIPVAVSASESLEALRKGTVDGYWGSSTSLIDYQFVQVLDNAVTNLPLNGWGGVFSINLDRFNSLPEASQKAIEQASEEMARDIGAYVHDYTSGSWDRVSEAGVALYEVDEEVVGQVAEKLEPITKAWLAEQDAAGYPATEVYNQFREAYERNLKTQ